MQQIEVDPELWIVRADAGVTWGEFDQQTQAYGLATTGGVYLETGVASLTLGRGHGWLMRSLSLAWDNLRHVDMVTADGRFLTASTTENAGPCSSHPLGHSHALPGC